MTITMAGSPQEWTLTEAARLLDVPQHRLIYLCEKGVVQPDLGDARGRGTSRRFSARNLLEFAVALRTRDLEIPAAVVGTILHVLRAFERSLAGKIPGFRLPNSLRGSKAPDLRVVISDGQRLYFTLGGGRGARRHGETSTTATARVEHPSASVTRRLTEYDPVRP